MLLVNVDHERDLNDNLRLGWSTWLSRDLSSQAISNIHGALSLRGMNVTSSYLGPMCTAIKSYEKSTIRSKADDVFVDHWPEFNGLFFVWRNQLNNAGVGDFDATLQFEKSASCEEIVLGYDANNQLQVIGLWAFSADSHQSLKTLGGVDGRETVQLSLYDESVLRVEGDQLAHEVEISLIGKNGVIGYFADFDRGRVNRHSALQFRRTSWANHQSALYSLFRLTEVE